MVAPTLRSVALKAGVATSTVSRALRNHSSIPKATCERIQALAKAMGYRPDPLIAALVDRRWNRGGQDLCTIAWVTTYLVRPDPRGWFYPAILKGAKARAQELGYELEEFWLRESGMTARRLSQVLLHRGIRGVCVPPIPAGRGHINLKWEHFSCAAIGYSMIRPNLHRASPHQFQGIMEALRQLRRLGYRRIGVWMNEVENRKVNYQWMAGTLLFQQLYVGVKFSLLVCDDTDQDQFLQWVKEQRPDVVLGSTDAVRFKIKGLGLNIDSATMAWHKDAGIPGIDQKFSEIGSAAIDLIVGQLRNNETGIPSDPRVVMVEGEWRDGTSTRP